MKLFNQIQSDRNQARLRKDTKTVVILNTLLGEIGQDFSSIPVSKRPEAPTDSAVLSKIKANLKGLALLKELRPTPEVDEEIKILSQYQPEILEVSALQNIIETRLQSYTPDKGHKMMYVMDHLKTNYSEQYDGKVAASIIKGLTQSV